MFTKKSFIEENTLLDVSDEELAEFSGGSGPVGGLLNTVSQNVPATQIVTDPVTKLLGGTNVQTNTTLQTPAGNLGLNTPKNGLLGNLI